MEVQLSLKLEHVLFNAKESLIHVESYAFVAKAVQPILGLRDTLGLIQRVHAIQISHMSKEMIKIELSDVFTGLGNLGKYHITLKDNAVLVC